MLVSLGIFMALVLWGLHVSLDRYNRQVVPDPPISIINLQPEQGAVKIIFLGKEFSPGIGDDLEGRVQQMRHSIDATLKRGLDAAAGWFGIVQEKWREIKTGSGSRFFVCLRLYC